MTRKPSFLILLLLFLVACEPSNEQHQASLKEEVIALHDSAMARMGELMNQKLILLQLQDSLLKTDAAASQNLSEALRAVTTADEAMWQWMRAYKPDNQKPEERLHYLQQEKVKMQNVWQDMEKSLQMADSLGNIYSAKQK
jgi:hypothetical protein